MEIGVNKEFYEHLKELFFEELSSNYKRGHRKPLTLTKDSFEILYENTNFDMHYDDDDEDISAEDRDRRQNTIWSYIEFKIKELPQWRFGADFSIDVRTVGENGCKIGVWYAQYERFIDKFKASRSHLVGDFYYEPANIDTDPEFCYPENLSIDTDFLECIIDKPARAFCTDRGYNQYDYLSAPRAYFIMWREVLHDILYNEKKLCINKYILRPAVRALKHITGAFIKDEENCSPRYTIYIPESFCRSLHGELEPDDTYIGFYELNNYYFGVTKLDNAFIKVFKRKEYIKKKFKSGWWYDQVNDDFYVYPDPNEDWIACAHRSDCEGCKFCSDVILQGGFYCHLRAKESGCDVESIPQEEKK